MVFPPYLELSPIPVACGHGPVVSRCTHLVALQDPYTLSTKQMIKKYNCIKRIFLMLAILYVQNK